MTWSLVVNPVAGRGRTAKLLPDLVAHADRMPDVAATHVSSSATDACEHARAAAAAGHDLVACGGDGLVGMLAGVAAEAGRRLAIVPSGAGNDFAASLGYDARTPLDALDVLASGVDRVVDLGRVDLGDGSAPTWYAGVTASGFDAEANRWANGVSWLRGSPLYVAAAMRTLAVFRPQRFAVTVDGAREEHDAWMVAVGNNTRYAGGMHVTPGARLDDGLLDVCIVGGLSIPRFLAAFPKVFSGAHVEHPAVTTKRGREVTITPLAPDADLEVWADGERVGALPATMCAVTGALTVRVPG